MKKKFNSLSEMIQFYESDLQQPLLQELELCRKVVLSSKVDDSKKAEVLLMGGHQWHLNLRPTEKEGIINTLKDAKLWKCNYTDFEDVYDKVVNTIGDLEYVGFLTCYDVAKRIGFCCGHEPECFVYLHSGARKGAKNLLNIPRLSGNTMDKMRFATLLPGLSALHIENFLCIMKDIFVDGKINQEAEIDSNKCCFRCYFTIPEDL